MKNINSYFTKENVQMANKPMKRGSGSLDMRVNATKPQRCSPSHLLERLPSKGQTILRDEQDVEELGPSFTASGNVKCFYYGKQVGSSSKC